jgi:hypothetical protein
MIDTPNARTEANRQTIRQAFAAWQQGTGPITEVFAPELVWRIEGLRWPPRNTEAGSSSSTRC